jgi:beta-phosphoglucomutase-like phosphatase (HAD superfamily)
MSKSTAMSRFASGFIARSRYDAVLLDMDGVITDTASIHAFCWKGMFDEFLQEWATRHGVPFRSFDDAVDYKLHVDGKPRYWGVRDFLSSREIVLPDGTSQDPPSFKTVCGLGNRKNELVNAHLASFGVNAYPGTVAFVMYLRRMGLKTAVVTSSENCQTVLRAARVDDLFDARVDGTLIAEQQLNGKGEGNCVNNAATERLTRRKIGRQCAAVMTNLLCVNVRQWKFCRVRAISARACASQ